MRVRARCIRAPLPEKMTVSLEQIQSPADLRRLSRTDLKELATQLRSFVLSSVSRTGGHLSSNLGTVELTIALHTVFELLRSMAGGRGAPRVHVCRLSSAEGVALLRQAKAEGLGVSADVSIHSLYLTDQDVGHFDSRARLNPPLRQARDRDALAAALADGVIDALVSDHTPVEADAKHLPFAEAEPGATGLELLLPLAAQWGQGAAGVQRALAAVTHAPAQVLGGALGTLQASCGQLIEGGVADVCVFDPQARWRVEPAALRSQGKHTPFEGRELTGRVRCTLVGGHLAHGGA